MGGQTLSHLGHSCFGMARRPRYTAQAAETAGEPISQQTLTAGGRRPQRGRCIRANPIHAFGNRSAAKWKVRRQSVNGVAKLPAVNGAADLLLLDFRASRIARTAGHGPCVWIDRCVRGGSL